MSANKNFDEDLALGYIPIDSVHSPVHKVNFTRKRRARPDDRLRQAYPRPGPTALSLRRTPSDTRSAERSHGHLHQFEELPEAAEETTEYSLDKMGEQLNRSVEAGVERPLTA
jgi:DNA-directed RNA polymerase subunit alpha